FSPDGSRIVAADSDNSARIWNVLTREPATPPLQHPPHNDRRDDRQVPFVAFAVFSPDGKQVLTASTHTTACRWDADTGAMLGQPLEHERGVCHAAFSPDGLRLVTVCSDDSVYLWDSQTGESIAKRKQHQSGVTQAAFSPDGRRTVSAGSDGRAEIWN